MWSMLALVALGVFAMDAAAAPPAQRVQILADRVDVRSYSSPEAPVIASVSRGTILDVLAREGDWIRIPIPESGYPGYVPAVYCQLVQPGVTPALPPSPQAAPPRPPSSATAPTPAPLPQLVSPQPAPAIPAPSAPPPAQVETPSIPSGSFSSTPKVELSVGYSYLHADWLADTEVVSGSVPYGLVFAANFNLNRWLGLVVDLGGHYKSEEVSVFGYGADFGLTVGSLHGGLRLSGRGNPSVTPYAQFLAGGTSYQADFDGETFGDLETEFSIQPGVGVIFGLSDLVGLEVGADYRRIFVEGEGANEFRAHVGVTFRLGSK